MNILYSTKVTSQGGRNGHVRSEDGVIDFDVAIPGAMGGSGKVATNPEQLFAAGYAACFENAVLHVSRAQKIRLTSTEVTAEVGIGPREEGGFALAVSLAVTLSGVDQATAEALVAAAHQVCPYSNATRGNVDVKLSTQVK
jgi:Ohr subfamily peroxiredoxin